jgi:hypothetical protein
VCEKSLAGEAGQAVRHDAAEENRWRGPNPPIGNLLVKVAKRGKKWPNLAKVELPDLGDFSCLNA